jgi:mono/diheme cytochrome c family protein
MRIIIVSLLVASGLLLACADDQHVPTSRLRAEQPALCERDRGDKVRDIFCSADAPTITGLADLQKLLQAVPGEPPDGYGEQYPPSAPVTMLGHSTALSGQRVSPLNPRLIVISDDVIVAFQRGVQKVEVIAEARNPSVFNFYLIEFEQACNLDAHGCSPGDLYTPRVEQDWLRVSIQDDEDLKNTVNDCRQCHQRASVFPRLLMRELNNPWTHFFQPLPASADVFVGPGVQGHNLLQDYLDAKGDELYGGFAPKNVLGLGLFLLESTVLADQPVLFDAPGIENERFPFDPDRGYPEDPGHSPTWEAAFEAFKRGEQLALPYVEARVTDPDKHRDRTEAYRRYRDGELTADELPDLADIFSDEPHVRARLGLQTEPDASAEEALIQACGSCHNDVLDQSLSRARFNIDLWKLDRSEIAQAIARIERAPDAPGVMPPPEARQLDPQARARLLDYLRADPLAREPDPRLQHAAALGMAGGADRRAGPRL